MNSKFRYLLFPISILYGCVIKIRNYLYDKKLLSFKPQIFDIPVISVGNITVGGTGKSPHIEYLIRLLKNKIKVAVISRGYKRKTKGFLLANELSTPLEIGDEPFQFYSKFKKEIHVVVGEKRAIAIPHLLSIKPETQVILLDDAFQHRGVKPQLNILLIDYNRLIFNDLLLPMGNLREPVSGLNRADIIIISKCPNELDYKREYIKLKLANHVKKKWKPIFFTSLKYSNPIQFYGNKYDLNENSSVIVVAGLAQNKPFLQYVKNNFEVIESILHEDHYDYKLSDIEKIIKYNDKYFDNNICFITTEKDMVKLKNTDYEILMKDIPCFYIPIEIYFLENETQFQKMIFKTVQNIC